MTGAPPFVILSLPRSRSLWLSKFLSYGGWTCHHDLVAKDPDIDKIFRILAEPMTSIADTGLGYGWKLIRRWFPAAKLVTIRRPVDEVRASMIAAGVPAGLAAGYDFAELDDRLDEAEDEGGAESFQFHELDRDIERLWAATIGGGFNHRWFEFWRGRNEQIDMRHRLEVLAENHHRLKALRHVVREHLYGHDPARALA